MLKEYNKKIKKISDDPRSILKVKPSDHKVPLLRAALKKDFNILYDFPPEFITSELAEAAVSVDPRSISYFPKRVLNYKSCEIAAQKYSEAIRYIPEVLIDDEIIEMALSRWGSAIKFLSHKMIDSWVVEIAIDGGAMLHEIPDEFINDELYKKALGVNGFHISSIPGNSLSRDMLNIAINKSPSLITRISEKLLDHDLVMVAIQRSGRCAEIIQKIGAKYRTDEVLYEASAKDVSVIQFLEPKDLKRLTAYSMNEDVKDHPYLPRSLEDAINGLAKKNDIHALDWAAKYLAGHYLIEEIAPKIKQKMISKYFLEHLAKYFDTSELAKTLDANQRAKRLLLGHDLDL